MKKTLFTAALLAAFGVAALAPQAYAANTSSGTITIPGSVVTSTCNVTVNGTSGNGTVALPAVDTGSLASTGASAGWTSFPVVLSGCGTSATDGTNTYSKVAPYFYGTSVDTASGFLDNSGGTSNVQVALSNAPNTTSALKLNLGAKNQNVTAQTLSASNITFTFYAGYVAQTASATAGTVSTTVQYNLNYQ